jgi:hypothetical protein
MSGTTLMKLPKQPLPPPPGGRPVGPTFSTIWLIVFLVFYVLFDNGPRREFYGTIGYAALLLAMCVVSGGITCYQSPVFSDYETL